MHASQLVELAAYVSAHGPVLLGGQAAVSSKLLQDYWTVSKLRLDAWSRELKTYETTWHETPAQKQAARFRSLRTIIEEILASEALTRVWAAVVTACDQKRSASEGEPIVSSILLGHVEARHRALTLLIHGPGVPVEDAVAVNKLRSHLERWTDLLVGYLLSAGDVARFAAQPSRAREFADDLTHQGAWQAGREAWTVLLASLRGGVRSMLRDASPNAQLNRQIAASIAGCFQPHMFDAGGLVNSPWPDRIFCIADDTEEMIEQLWSMEGIPSPAAVADRKASTV
ncbi:MAG: hypothetical protein HYS13_06775 [Planctomycetia bacterium]|nr:hypothetical protein [Planctomycetia bacterium]